jgi:hypothetical protein
MLCPFCGRLQMRCDGHPLDDPTTTVYFCDHCKKWIYVNPTRHEIYSKEVPH